MNVIFCKVNTRYIILCVFVLFLFLAVFANAKTATAQTPTLNPTEAERKRQRDIHEELEEERSKYVNTGLSYEQIKKQSQKEIWSILGRLFSGVGQPVITSSPDYIPPPGSAPISDELKRIIPDGDAPAGHCTDVLNQALTNLGNHPSNIAAYVEGSKVSGVPWEAIAAIHYIESGGDFNPNQRLKDGRPLDGQTLTDSAIEAGNHFKIKMNSAPGANDFEKMVATFAMYNGTGNAQCDGLSPKPQSKYSGCPAKYYMEDHLYPMGCFDKDHEHMWIIYCGDGQKCASISASNPDGNEYRNRVGAMTLIRGIQKLYSQSPNNPGGGTPGPTFPPPVGFRRSPRDAETIVSMMSSSGYDSVKQENIPNTSCDGGRSINSNNVDACMASLGDSVSDRLTDEIKASTQYTYLQCVGFARALAYEIDGKPGGTGNACAQAKDSTNYRFIPYGNTPAAGDMVVFCRGYASVGHIAYISEVQDSANFRVAEAHMNGIGGVSVRNVGVNNNIQGYLRLK